MANFTDQDPCTLPVQCQAVAWRFQSLARGVAGRVRGRSTGLASGERPQLGSRLLTWANAGRFAERLAYLRGAAMKFGQMISTETGNLLFAEL